MKKLLTALCLLSPLAQADSDTHPVTMWKASGETNAVYLLGSIHLLREQDHPLPSIIDDAYDDAEVLIMEVDMDDLDPIAAQQAFTDNGVLKNETTLEDLMGDAGYQRARTAAEENDIPLHLLARTEPWYAAMTVEVLMLGRIGFDANLGVEMHMTAKAVGDGKPIEGLETIEEQVSFLDGLSMSTQRQLLISTLEESAKLADMMDEIIGAWRRGDLETLERELLESFGEFDELRQAILVDRNERWVEHISELLDDEQDYLIIVGAAHLIGEDGVPRRLSDRGIEIRQLSETSALR